MGLMKTLHTKHCEGTRLSAAERKAGGLEVPSSKKKNSAAGPKKSDAEFIKDMLDDLL